MADRRNLGRLTPAELRVVRAIIAGHTTADQLAGCLTTSPRTIQSHLGSIYKKLGAYNKADVILMAQGTKDCAIDLVGQLEELVPRRKGRVRHGTTAR